MTLNNTGGLVPLDGVSIINLQNTTEENLDMENNTNTNIQNVGVPTGDVTDMQTTEIRDLDFYVKGIATLTDESLKLLNKKLDIEETTKEVNKMIDQKEAVLLEQARKEYEELQQEVTERRTALDAAKAVLSERQAVLAELEDIPTALDNLVYEEWPEEEEESTTVSEEVEVTPEVTETIIDTTEEKLSNHPKGCTLDKETTVEGGTKEEGFKATTLNIGGNYILIEKPINSYQIGQIGKALKTIDREAALDIINNTLLDYLSDKQYQALKKRLGLEDIVVEEGPKESTAKVDGVYPCSTTKDETHYDKNGEELPF